MALMIAGCAGDAATNVEPATIDCREGPGTTFCEPIGEACSSSSAFCARGLAWCSLGTCRAFCSSVAFPRCPRGQTEHHERYGYGTADVDVCVCVPD